MGNDGPQAAGLIVGIQGSTGLTRAVKQLFSDLDGVTVEPVPSVAQESPFANPGLLVIEVRPEQSSLTAFLGDLRSRFGTTPIVAASASADHRVAVQLVRAGVLDYVVWPEEQHRLYDIVDRMLAESSTHQEKQAYVESQVRSFDFSHIIGLSPELLKTLTMARKVASTDRVTVLIMGETGTGKGLLAKAIHYNSPRRGLPFVEISCSALPETLLESELFGHERGAFTDAREKKAGLFEIAGHGTIFLDEIGDISAAVQSKLLKVLEEKTMRRVGGVKDIVVEARIIAATSRNLSDLVSKGLFRRDLYYRLNIVPLILPPLRDRRGDIPILIQHFLKYFGAQNGKPAVKLTAEALHSLTSHVWEGNVRELMHAIERAVVLTESDEIGPEAFSFPRRATPSPQFADTKAAGVREESMGADLLNLSLPLQHADIEHAEKLLVREVLRRVHGNKSRAAAMLKISRPRLERILRQDPDFFRPVLSK